MKYRPPWPISLSSYDHFSIVFAMHEIRQVNFNYVTHGSSSTAVRTVQEVNGNGTNVTLAQQKPVIVPLKMKLNNFLNSLRDMSKMIHVRLKGPRPRTNNT